MIEYRFGPRRGRRMRRLSALAAALLLVTAPRPAGAAETGLQRDVVFARYSDLSASGEITRRLLSPLAVAELDAALARSGKAIAPQSVDLAQERFTVYVPPQAPPKGYGLLVFVPPWPEATLPDGWGPVLDKAGIIFVTAAGTGNDANVLGRRIPLALIAAENVIHAWPVDPERIFVGGFSGGSRIALRLALAYPDLFRGALLNAGADPLGAGPFPLPPRDLFLRFQTASRLVYVTGGQDSANLRMDSDSLASMRNWCVFNTEDQVTAFVGHQVAGPSALGRALEALARPLPAGPSRREACQAGLDRELDTRLKQADALLAAGRRDELRKLLILIDRRFGGLAAPRSVALYAP